MDVISENKSLKLDVSEDRLTAVIEINRDGASEAMASETIITWLEQLKLVLDQEHRAEVKAFSEKISGSDVPSPLVVAKGLSPVDDAPGKIELLVKATDKVTPGAGGNVNHYERSKLIVVESGQALIHKQPPVQGVDGVDVFGAMIPRKRVSSDPKIIASKNVEWSSDGATLHSTAAGQLCVAGGKVWVDPVLTLSNNVDFSTGNIVFPGNINIKNNVMDLFSVKSEGRIEVGGAVQSAYLESAKDIVIKGGIVGSEKGECIAGGDISAKYVTNATLRAAGAISVQVEVANSNVYAGTSITTEKGVIVGGKVIAGHSISCHDLGSDGDVKTYAEVGMAPSLKKLCQEQIPKVIKMRERAIEVHKVVDPLMRNQKRLLPAQKEKATELLCEAMELESESDEITKEIQKQFNALQENTPNITITGTLFSSVTIRFPRVEAHIQQAIVGPIQLMVRDVEGQPRSVCALDLTNKSVIPLESKHVRDETLNTITKLLSESD